MADQIIERLHRVFKVQKDIDLADAMGIARNTISGWRAREQVPAAVLKKVSDSERVSVDWLQSGVGEESLAGGPGVVREAHITASLGVAEIQADYLATPTPEEFVTIPSLGIMAGASRGKIAVYEPKAPLAFRRDWFIKKRLNPAQCATIEISGPSMEPLLSDCDTALLNRADKEIRSGKTYVFRLDDEIMVKHLHWLPGGALNVISANKDFDPFPIQPQDMTPENFEVLGRVRGSSHDWD